MSPKEVKMTSSARRWSGRGRSSPARSRTTGQPGPCTSSTDSGIMRVDAVGGRWNASAPRTLPSAPTAFVARAAMRLARPLGQRAVPYFVEVLHGVDSGWGASEVSSASKSQLLQGAIGPGRPLLVPPWEMAKPTWTRTNSPGRMSGCQARQTSRVMRRMDLAHFQALLVRDLQDLTGMPRHIIGPPQLP